jgi:hypothetical protein
MGGRDRWRNSTIPNIPDAEPEAIEALRDELLAHLGAEGASNQEFVNRFMMTEEMSFQNGAHLEDRQLQ